MCGSFGCFDAAIQKENGHQTNWYEKRRENERKHHTAMESTLSTPLVTEGFLLFIFIFFQNIEFSSVDAGGLWYNAFVSVCVCVCVC